LLSGCALIKSQTVPAPVTPIGATVVPQSGGILRMTIPGDIVPRNAPFALTPANGHLFTLIYDTLVAYDTQLTPQPRLATGWEWSPDARRLTLRLRSGVTFHSGRPFTSGDAKFTLERLRDPTVGSQWRNYADLMHVTTPNPTTLVIDYDSPFPGSFDALSATFMADPQSLDDTISGRGFVGTGPFRFQEWSPGDHVTVTRNPAYWQVGKPYLDDVEFRIVPDTQSALAFLEAGSVDWMTSVPGRDARRLQSDPKYQVMETAGGGTFYYVGLDLTMPGFADQRVRQALNYAVNRPRMVDATLDAFGRPTSIPWPRQSPGFDASQDQRYTYDLNMAHQLLDAAGWNSDATVPLFIASSLAPTRTMAQIYQADLATIGVKVAVRELEFGDFYNRLANGQFGGAWIANMSFMNLSPATYFTSALPVRIPNASHFETQRYKQLISQITAETDMQRLRALLHEATEILLDESFIAPIAESTGVSAGLEVARSSVRDVAWDINSFFAYENIRLERQVDPN
jgi:peptide/nickel transport system substrate-binding protein